jgi:hypothetical protein
MMKTKTIFLYLLVLIFIILAIFFAISFFHKGYTYDSTKAEDLMISKIAQSLEFCQGYTQKVATDTIGIYRDCSYDIDNLNLTKLKSMENLEGVKLCDFDDRNQQSNCKLEDYYNDNSKVIWFFEWTGVSVKINYHFLRIWKSGDNYFYTYAENIGAGIPYSGSIFLLDKLDSSLITSLKQ